MDGSYIPAIAKTFMNSTRAQVEHENVLVTAASFTFGREALLPSIFMELIKQPMLKVRFKHSRQKTKKLAHRKIFGRNRSRDKRKFESY